MKAPKLPAITITLMVIFIVIGCIAVSIPNLPRIFFGVDGAVLFLGYFGYLYVILACLFYALTGK